MSAATVPLYAIADALLDVHDQLVDNGGELTPEIEELLASLKLELVDKVDAICGLIRHGEALATAASDEAKRLAELARSRDRAAAKLKEYVRVQLERAGKTKVETPRFVASVQRNGQPSIRWTGQADDVPEDYQRWSMSVDLQLAAQHVRNGQELPDGFSVERGSHLRIR